MPDDGGGEEGEQAGDVLAIEDKTEKSAERYNGQNYQITCILTFLLCKKYILKLFAIMICYFSAPGGAADLGEKQLAAMEAAEKLASSKSAKVEGPASAIDFGGISKMIVSFLARNFFTLKLIALVIAFTINFMLLFYKVGGNEIL